jgi:hypothetical protein
MHVARDANISIVPAPSPGVIDTCIKLGFCNYCCCCSLLLLFLTSNLSDWFWRQVALARRYSANIVASKASQQSLQTPGTGCIRSVIHSICKPIHLLRYHYISYTALLQAQANILLSLCWTVNQENCSLSSHNRAMLRSYVRSKRVRTLRVLLP